MPLSGCLRRICLAEGPAPAAGASSGVSAIGEQTELGEEGEEEQSRRRSVKGRAEVTVMHQTQEHMEITCTPSPVHKPQCPVLGSCVVFPEKILQQMSVCECGADHRACSWESRRKIGTFPPFPSPCFFTPSCVFSGPVRSGGDGTGQGQSHQLCHSPDSSTPVSVRVLSSTH